ncbi:phage head closure protein [Evansella cellulosilytica]|uniref:Phage head-tail adaptor n=1 Tax=Evansella cellulosilytica (strain ATCC 21833 / DSM 2522 / FERM P-1141 / JCM 9156 / N-4) TaxID=649639 RepID=E6TVG5_EVAC2|nr:phage head closure protein [Evansella cellulosilytica]ADU30982.1 phage head-tail adaptor [Evansella cellulosilytica DSM 2522]
MNPGRARHRITFLSPPEKGDFSSHNDLGNWPEYTTVWAELETKPGRFFSGSDRNFLQSMKVFKIRYRKDLEDNESMRVMYKGKPYELVEPISNVDGMNIDLLVVLQAVK